MSGIVIGTSIAPRGIGKQLDAVESWLGLGFEVLSLNTPVEIDSLAPQFPEVSFRPVHRTAESLTGRPLVFFDDLLGALHATRAPVVGIVNSDVTLRGVPSVPAFLRQEAAGGFLFGSRRDTVTFEQESARVYAEGYDFFFFARDAATVYPRTDLCLGMPWWDYWAPLVALMRGLPVKRLESPLAFHPHHDTAWDNDNWIRFGALFARELHMLVQSAIVERRMTAEPSESERWMSLGGELAFESYLWRATEYNTLVDRLQEAARTGKPDPRLAAQRDQLVAWYRGICTFTNRYVNQHARPVAFEPAAALAEAVS
ncbi:MAG: hypothetical protein WD270_10405 [Acetobacterales bacterium]